jgi:hypothetical protein
MKFSNLIIVLSLFIISALACSSTPPTVTNQQFEESFMAVAALHQIPNSGFPEKIEGSGSQNGKDVTLNIIVPKDTKKKIAQSLGNRFILNVMKKSPDTNPSLKGSLKKGKLSYTVTITDTDGTVISKGTKDTDEESITWGN